MAMAVGAILAGTDARPPAVPPLPGPSTNVQGDCDAFMCGTNHNQVLLDYPDAQG